MEYKTKITEKERPTMYMSRMLEVGKAANGFVIECRVPLKPEAKSTAKMDSCCCVSGSSSCEKQYIAKDAKELAEIISDVIPLLDGDYKTESDFDKAFSEATSEMEEKGEKE